MTSSCPPAPTLPPATSIHGLPVGGWRGGFSNTLERAGPTGADSQDCGTCLPAAHAAELTQHPASSYSQGTASALRPVPGPKPPPRGRLCPKPSEAQPAWARPCPSDIAKTENHTHIPEVSGPDLHSRSSSPQTGLTALLSIFPAPPTPPTPYLGHQRLPGIPANLGCAEACCGQSAPASLLAQLPLGMWGGLKAGPRPLGDGREPGVSPQQPLSPSAAAVLAVKPWLLEPSPRHKSCFPLHLRDLDVGHGLTCVLP